MVIYFFPKLKKTNKQTTTKKTLPIMDLPKDGSSNSNTVFFSGIFKGNFDDMKFSPYTCIRI